MFVPHCRRVLLGFLLLSVCVGTINRSAVAASSSVLNATVAAKTKEIKIADQAGLPSFVIQGVLKQMKQKHNLDSLPLDMDILNEKGKPAANQKFEARYAGGKTTVTTDAKGHLQFGLTKKNGINLRLVVPDNYTVNVKKIGSAKVTGGGGGAGGKSVKLSDLKKLSYQDIDVFHDNNEKLARHYLSRLAEMRGYIEGETGLEVVSEYGMALIARGAQAPRLTIEGRVVIPVFYNPRTNTTNSMTEWILVHEWLEGSIIFRTGAYSQNPNLRFVGDGLAELLSYNYCQRHSKASVINRLNQYMISFRAWQMTYPKKPNYNLLQNFPSGKRKGGDARISVAGYAASYYFWKKLQDEHGPVIARKFIKWFLSTEDYSNKAVVAQLTKLTGAKPKTVIPVKEMQKEIGEMLKKLKESSL